MILEDLLVDEKELDRDLLGRILSPYVRIGKDSGKIRFTPLVGKLGIKEKIIVFLLAKKAAAALSIPGAEESATPKELEKELGIKGSSIRPILKGLYDAKAVSGEKGRYWVGNYILPEVEERFFGNMKGGEKKKNGK